MSQSDEDKTSAKPTKKVIDINDLIAKPDPFANGMVVKKKWSEGNDKNIFNTKFLLKDLKTDENQTRGKNIPNEKYFSFLQLY